jgi:hypothetical protein
VAAEKCHKLLGLRGMQSQINPAAAIIQSISAIISIPKFTNYPEIKKPQLPVETFF